MAKKKTQKRNDPHTDRRVGLPPGVAIASPDPPAVTESGQPQTARSSVHRRLIEAPCLALEEGHNGYLTRHVEVARLGPRQRRTLRELYEGLRSSGERLANGKPIESAADAVRWLLDELGRTDPCPADTR